MDERIELNIIIGLANLSVSCFRFYTSLFHI
jgi:hypothetical protein